MSSPVYSLDRKENDLGYSKDNCHWTTIDKQAINKRVNHFVTYNGKRQTVKEWADETGIPYRTLQTRIRTGFSLGEAFSTKRLTRRNFKALSASA